MIDKKLRLKGRRQRWAASCDAMNAILQENKHLKTRWIEAVEDLREIQNEYALRLATLPPNLRNSKLARQLQAIVDVPLQTIIIDRQPTLNDLETMVLTIRVTPLPDAFKKMEN